MAWTYEVTDSVPSWVNNSSPTDEQKANADMIIAYFRNLGATDAAIAGLLGNIAHESYINPGQQEIGYDGSTSYGYGLIQWTPGSGLISWCETYGYNWYDGDAQCERINCEGTGEKGAEGWYATSSYPYSWSEFLALTDYEEATNAYLYERERPGSVAAGARLTYAAYWYDYIQNEYDDSGGSGGGGDSGGGGETGGGGDSGDTGGGDSGESYTVNSNFFVLYRRYPKIRFY